MKTTSHTNSSIHIKTVSKMYIFLFLIFPVAEAPCVKKPNATTLRC